MRCGPHILLARETTSDIAYLLTSVSIRFEWSIMKILYMPGHTVDSSIEDSYTGHGWKIYKEIPCRICISIAVLV